MLSGAGRTRPRRRTATYLDAKDFNFAFRPQLANVIGTILEPRNVDLKDWDLMYLRLLFFCYVWKIPRHQELPPDEAPQGHICYDFLTFLL